MMPVLTTRRPRAQSRRRGRLYDRRSSLQFSCTAPLPVNRQIASMSAIGTKRTWQCVHPMSAFGGKADMLFCTANVRF